MDLSWIFGNGGDLDMRHLAAPDVSRRLNELAEARAGRLETALRAIIARADTDKPGTSKVQDMRYIAVKALEE